MSGEFDAEVRNSLRALTAQVSALSKAQSRLESDTRRYGDTAAAAFRKGAGSVATATRNVDTLGQSVGRTSQAIGRMGGPLGSIISRLGGGAGLAGGLGAVGAAAAVAGIALSLFNRIVQKNLEDARAAAEAHVRMAKAMDQAGEATKRLAAAGLGQATARRSLLAVGGEGAVRDADAVEKSGVASGEEAAQGVGAIYGAFGRFGKRAGNRAPALAIAADLAAGGMPYAEAAAAVAQVPGDLNNSDVARRAKGSIFASFSGVSGAHQGNLALGLAKESIARDPLLGASRGTGQVRALTADIEEDLAITAGSSAARADLAAAASPTATAQAAGYNATQEQVEILRLIYEETKRQRKAAVVAGGGAASATAEFLAEQAYLRASKAASRGLQFAPGG